MVEKLIAGVSALALTATIATTTPEIVEVFDGSQEAVTLEASGDFGIMPLSVGGWTVDSISMPYRVNSTSGTVTSSTYSLSGFVTSTQMRALSLGYFTSSAKVSTVTVSAFTVVISYTFSDGEAYGVGGNVGFRFVAPVRSTHEFVMPSAYSATATFADGTTQTVELRSKQSSSTYMAPIDIVSTGSQLKKLSFTISFPSYTWTANVANLYSFYWQLYMYNAMVLDTTPPPEPNWGELIYNAIQDLARLIVSSGSASDQILGGIAGDVGIIKDVVADPTDMAINQSMQENKEAFADTFLPGGSNNTNENGTSASVTPEQIEQVGEVSQNAQEMIDAGGSVEDAFSWASDSSLFSWFSDQTMQDLDGTAPAGVDDLDLVSYYEDLLADLQSQAYVDGFIMTRW